jgi:4-hydroxybenzoate polyprenyltransferase
MAKLRNMIYNSVTVSLPKNTIQFFLGFTLFFLIMGTFNPGALALSLFAFLVTYSAVYFYNDIVDYHDDLKDTEKREWKLVAGGALSKKSAATMGIACAVVGLYASLLVSGWFFLMMAALLFLNYLHSSPHIRLKKRIAPTALNMTVIEFIKYSSGWFAFTENLSMFPFWIILTFSLVYATIYLVYKFKFKGDMIRSRKLLFATIGAVCIASYVISMVLYKFALPLIMLLVLSVALGLFGKSRKLKFMNWLFIEFIIMPAVIAVFLLLSIPIVGQANEKIGDKIGQYKETVYKELPEEVAEGLKNLSEPPYDSLDEIERDINRTLNITISEITIQQ